MSENYDYLERNIDEVRRKIGESAVRSGRKFEDISLIAVTKTFEMDLVNRAIDFGISDVAENRVQEILRKYPLLKSDQVRRHMIGSLQRNKVKHVIDKVDLIHSVDSKGLVEEIDKRAKSGKRLCDILIQINVAGEIQKGGVSLDEYEELLEFVSGLQNIRLRGLMMMAPFIDDRALLREYFKKTKKIFDNLCNIKYNSFKIDTLSMGMSGDFDLAIEEGANMVRIGSAIFGKRVYV